MLRFKHASRFSPKSMRDLHPVCVAPSPPAWLHSHLLFIPPAFFFFYTHNFSLQSIMLINAPVALIFQCRIFVNPDSFPLTPGVHQQTLVGGGGLRFAQPLVCIQMNAGMNWILGCSLHFSSLCCGSPPPLPQNCHQIGRSYILMRPIIAL